MAKKVIMWKYQNCNQPSRCYGWSEKEVYNDWDHIYSDPYYVEIPDDFSLEKTKFGDMMYFKKGCNRAYEVLTYRPYCEGCSPYLVGGDPTETIKLKVIGPVPEDELPD